MSKPRPGEATTDPEWMSRIAAELLKHGCDDLAEEATRIRFRLKRIDAVQRRIRDAMERP